MTCGARSGNGRMSVYSASVLCLLLSAGVAAIPASDARAEDRAQQPVRILVPLPAGSTSDVVARLIADRLRTHVAGPVVVEDKPGASGRIAMEALSHAAADGKTLLLAPMAVSVILPLVSKDPSYVPGWDFAPVAHIASYEFAFAVGAEHPARTLAEFVAWARSNPTQASFGTPAAASVPHLMGVMLRQAAGIDFLHVAYNGFPALQAMLVGGHVASGISAVSDLIALHRAAKVRILATSGAVRSPLLREVPTFREQGYPSIEATAWHAVYAPARTPQPVVEKLSAAIVAAVNSPELRENFIAMGLVPTGTTPQVLASIIAADTARWRPIVKAAGFTGE